MTADALRRVETFARGRDDTLVQLASHAALPVVLNPDLVHLLRVNYFLDPPLALPYPAEAQLLLSTLCTEIDHDLYVINPELRDVLLQRLVEEFGISRLRDVARLLWEYGQRGNPWLDRPGLAEAQQLTAMNFIDPQRAQDWLRRAEEGSAEGADADRRWFIAMRQDLEGRAAAVERAQPSAHATDEQALAELQRRLGFDHPDTLVALSDIAAQLRRRGDYERARELDEEALVGRRRVLGPDHPDTLTSLSDLAADMRRLSRHERARELDEEALVGRRRVLGPDHPDTLTSLSDLAADMRRLSRHERARELDEEALVGRRRVLGPDHPDTLTSLSDLAADMRRLSRHERARELDEEALVGRRRVLGPDHPDTLTSLSDLAADMRRLSRHERARELDEEALVGRRRVLGPDHPDTLTSLSDLAADMRRLSRHERARELDEEALVGRRRVLGPDHPDTLTSLSDLAADMRRLSRHERARELDEEALVGRRRVLGPDHPDTLTSLSDLAADMRRLSRHERARELDEEALVGRRRVLGGGEQTVSQEVFESEVDESQGNLGGYEYDVFLSYSRSGQWESFVDTIFEPILSHWLEEELGRTPAIFKDREALLHSQNWLEELERTLRSSRVMVTLWSRQYFASEWCRRELSFMLARAGEFERRGVFSRIVLPVVIHGGRTLPSFLHTLQSVDLTEYANPFISRQSVLYEKLSARVQGLSSDVASAIEAVPDYSFEWDVQYASQLARFSESEQSQNEPPSLGGVGA